MLRAVAERRAGAAPASRCFSAATDSPVSSASSIEQAARAQQAQVGRHAVARLEQHHVAGHELARQPTVMRARRRAARAARGRDQLADRVERLLGLALLEEADDRVDQHDGEDDRRRRHSGRAPPPRRRRRAGSRSARC